MRVICCRKNLLSLLPLICHCLKFYWDTQKKPFIIFQKKNFLNLIKNLFMGKNSFYYYLKDKGGGGRGPRLYLILIRLN